jgi:5-formyltetrahydrofolate cyclo-ligase
MSLERGTIAVDLDASLAHYDGFKGHDHIGEPIKPMVDRVKKWISDGTKVVIFTARAHDPKAIPPIRAWLKEHIGQVLPVTNIKRPEFRVIYDDKAITLERNTGRILTVRKRAMKLAL